MKVLWIVNTIYPEAANKLGCVSNHPISWVDSMAHCIKDDKDIELVNHVIFDELCCGIINEDSRAEFSRIIAEMKEKSAEAVILGCTEIGNLIKQKDSVLPVFDTTVIHAESAAIFALGTE